MDEIAWSYHSNKTSFVEPCMTQIICIIWWLYNKNLNFLGNFHNGHYQKWKGQITAKIFSRNIRSRFLPMLVSGGHVGVDLFSHVNAILLATWLKTPYNWKAQAPYIAAPFPWKRGWWPLFCRPYNSFLSENRWIAGSCIITAIKKAVKIIVLNLIIFLKFKTTLVRTVGNFLDVFLITIKTQTR